MAQSIRKRLDGNLPEFVEAVRKKGIWDAMEEWHISCYSFPRVREILTEVTGDENFGLYPTASICNPEGIQRAMRTLINEIANFAIRNNKEKKLLRLQLDAYHNRAKSEEIDIMDALIGTTEMLRLNE